MMKIAYWYGHAAGLNTAAGAARRALPRRLTRFWFQRYSLWSRFDDGVLMDEAGWFSVTPEVLAWHHARQCRSFLRHGRLLASFLQLPLHCDGGGGGGCGNVDDHGGSQQSMPAAKLGKNGSILAAVASMPPHDGGSGHSQPVVKLSSTEHDPAAAASNLDNENAPDDIKLKKQHHPHHLKTGTADYGARHSSELTSTNRSEAAGTANCSTHHSSELISSTWPDAAPRAAEQAAESPAAWPAMFQGPAGCSQSEQMGKQALLQQTANDDQSKNDLSLTGHAVARPFHDQSLMLPTADGNPAESSDRQQTCQQASLQQQIGSAAGPPGGACAGVFVDGFAGVGGNAVQAALAGFQVNPMHLCNGVNALQQLHVLLR